MYEYDEEDPRVTRAIEASRVAAALQRTEGKLASPEASANISRRQGWLAKRERQQEQLRRLCK